MYLYDTLHEVLLCNSIPALDDLLQEVGQNVFLIVARVYTLQLGQTYEVCTHEDTQLQSFLLPPLLLSCVALVLHTDPEFVHLGKVVEDKCDGVFDRSILLTVCVKRSDM